MMTSNKRFSGEEAAMHWFSVKAPVIAIIADRILEEEKIRGELPTVCYVEVDCLNQMIREAFINNLPIELNNQRNGYVVFNTIRFVPFFASRASHEATPEKCIVMFIDTTKGTSRGL